MDTGLTMEVATNVTAAQAAPAGSPRARGETPAGLPVVRSGFLISLRINDLAQKPMTLYESLASYPAAGMLSRYAIAKTGLRCTMLSACAGACCGRMLHGWRDPSGGRRFDGRGR